MFEFFKKLFGIQEKIDMVDVYHPMPAPPSQCATYKELPKPISISTHKCKCRANLPKSNLNIPMPECKPTKNYVYMDLESLKYKKMEEVAYYLAEKDGFRDTPLSYWLEAEKQVRKEVG